MAAEQGRTMGVKRSDFAIRAEKNAMLRTVNAIQARYKMIDDAEWTLSKTPQEVSAVLTKYQNDLKGPILRFFAGETMEQIAAESHEAFIKAIDNYISTRGVDISRQVSAQLLESLRAQITRNVTKLLDDMHLTLTQRGEEFLSVMAKNANDATLQQLLTRQLKSEAIAAQTIGFAQDGSLPLGKRTETNLDTVWKSLTDKYGTRETVRYRDKRLYPLNTYLDARAVTTATEIHLATTELDAAQSGIHTGIIDRHGASDSCAKWEGKIVFFTPEGRDILSKRYPAASAIKTLQEVRDDEDSHIFKFNCRHLVTPYPVQFFDAEDAQKLIERSAA